MEEQPRGDTAFLRVASMHSAQTTSAVTPRSTASDFQEPNHLQRNGGKITIQGMRVILPMNKSIHLPFGGIRASDRAKPPLRCRRGR